MTILTSIRCICVLYHLEIIISFTVALRPNADHGLLIPEVSRSHTTTAQSL